MREKGKFYWIEKFNEKWKSFYDYSKLSENICWNKKEIIICPIHGEFEQTPNSHLKSGCPKCGRIRSDKAKLEKGKKNFEEYCKTQTYDYSKVDYVNSKTKVCIICPEHGEFWQTPNNHMHGQGCPKCGNKITGDKLRKNTEWFIEESRKIHGNLYDYSKVNYIGIHDKVTIICPIHGVWETTPHNHINYKCKCPKCSANKKELDLYNSLKKFFKNEQILFQYSPEWLKPQRFDIYIPNYNIAIEYDGIQHFKPQLIFGGKEQLEYQKELDLKKSDKCKENNCTLYRIPYNHSTEDIIDLILNINNFINA